MQGVRKRRRARGLQAQRIERMLFREFAVCSVDC
jgi:hypothetical protein